jgi:hypothetical protein
MNMFDPTKPVQTRDGRKARIICTDRQDLVMPIVALYRGTLPRGEGVSYHHADGTATYGSPNNDLVNIPEQVVRYVNSYHGRYALGGLYDDLSKEKLHAGDTNRDTHYSVMKLTFEDGKLIDSEVVR